MYVKNSKMMLIQWFLLFVFCIIPVIPQMMDPSYSPSDIYILCSAVYLVYTMVCALLFVKLYADIIFIVYGALTCITVILVRFAGNYIISTIMAFFFVFPHMGVLRLFAYSDIPLIVLSAFMIIVPSVKIITSRNNR